MLTLILADSELELVPPEISGHPSVSTHARAAGRKTTKILLDASVHHPAILQMSKSKRARESGGSEQRSFDGRGADVTAGEKGSFRSGRGGALPPSELRRGRPDIVHHFLMTALDSIPNIEGGLRVIIHTRNNEAIRIAPHTRLPKNYNRFVSLMEQLFAVGRIPPNADETLMTLERNVKLANLVKYQKGKVAILSPGGNPVDVGEYVSEHAGGDLVCIIGGFSDGDFISNIDEIPGDKISIYKGELKVWTVAAEILANWRLANAVSKKHKKAVPAAKAASDRT